MNAAERFVLPDVRDRPDRRSRAIDRSGVCRLARARRGG